MAIAEMRGSPTFGEERLRHLRNLLRPHVTFIHVPVASPFRHMDTHRSLQRQGPLQTPSYQEREGVYCGQNRERVVTRRVQQGCLTPNESVLMMLCRRKVVQLQRYQLPRVLFVFGRRGEERLHFYDGRVGRTDCSSCAAAFP